MGALITLQYNTKTVTDQEAETLAHAIQQTVKDVLSQNDVFVYANKSIVALADPIEIFIQVNKDETSDPAGLTEAIATRLSEWKQTAGFTLPVNINVHPVEWHYKIGI